MTLEIRELIGAEREAVYRLRYEVFVEQCGHRYPRDPRGLMYEPARDDPAIHLGAFVDGSLVGAASVFLGSRQEFDAHQRADYALEPFLAVLGTECVQLVDYVVVRDAYAGRVATPLFFETARIGIARGASLILVLAQPHHVRLYEVLGAEPSGPPIEDPGGLLFPLAFLPDPPRYDRLRAPSRSLVEEFTVAPPILAALRALLPDPLPVLTLRNAPELFRRRISETVARIAEAGLSDVATVQELAPLLDDSLLFDLPEGVLLTGEGMRHQTVYLVLAGSVEILADDEVIATCGPGRYVGEVAFLLDRPRMSDVLGGPEGATLLAFGPSALSRRTDAAGPFWRSVATDACAKLVGTSERAI